MTADQKCRTTEAKQSKRVRRDADIWPRFDRPVPAGVNAAGFGSDVVADALRALDIPYIALNPGASYRGLHDSLVNYLGNERPQMLLCLHEESAVAIAHGYAKVTGKAMAAAVHSNVGLMHATMAIFNAWCDRMPMVVLGATGPVDAAKRRPWIDWIHTARDQGALVRGYTKWDDQPASPAAAREAVLRAGWIANTAPRGPTYVNLDAEMQESKLPEPVPPIDAKRFMPEVAGAAPAAIDQAGRRPAAQRQASGDPCRAASRAISTPGTRASRSPSGSTRASSPTSRSPPSSRPIIRCMPVRPAALCWRRRQPMPSAPPMSSSASTGSTSPARSRPSAMSPPKSSRSRSITICTMAGAWTIRACRRSMCSSPASPTSRCQPLLEALGPGPARAARRGARRNSQSRPATSSPSIIWRRRLRDAVGEPADLPHPRLALVERRQLAVPPSARLSRLRRRRRRRRRPRHFGRRRARA